jgi:hypothetical protein
MSATSRFRSVRLTSSRVISRRWRSRRQRRRSGDQRCVVRSAERGCLAARDLRLVHNGPGRLGGRRSMGVRTPARSTCHDGAGDSEQQISFRSHVQPPCSNPEANCNAPIPSTSEEPRRRVRLPRCDPPFGWPVQCSSKLRWPVSGIDMRGRGIRRERPRSFLLESFLSHPVERMAKAPRRRSRLSESLATLGLKPYAEAFRVVAEVGAEGIAIRATRSFAITTLSLDFIPC